jgi:hypothetical protein
MADSRKKLDLPESPVGWAKRWESEFAAAEKNVEKWQERAEKIIKRYLDDRSDTTGRETRLNLFTANQQTVEAMLFGRTPEVDAKRRFGDPDDDVARVASELIERVLSEAMQYCNGAELEALRNALRDWRLVGLGIVKVHYEPGEPQTEPAQPAQTDPMTGQEIAPAVPEVEHRPDERAVVEHYYWKDLLWSPCRTFSQLRWWAFGNEMSHDQLVDRFGETVANALPMNTPSKSATEATEYKDPLDRCTVWEVWSKERGTVDWFVKGYNETLDHKDDPLELEGFWPFPRPMISNLTTSKLLPVPDFILAQDLYDEIDTISTRITLLERVIRAAGIYDSTNDGLKRLINESGGNELIPVDPTAMAAMNEKGGIANAVAWLPLEQIVNALTVLREYRQELIGLEQQITGMSDIMRGEASQQTTATEQAIKARFASVRVQSLQDEFARFCSDVQKIKAEIVANFFEPQTILTRANVQYMEQTDQQLAPQAVELIKSKIDEYRIKVDPDSVSLQDFAAIRAEKIEWAQGLAVLLQALMPLASVPGFAPLAGKIVQHYMGGFKGNEDMESILDQAIAQAEQQAQQAAQQGPPPNPQLEVAKVKAGAEQFKAQADVQSTQLDMQAKMMEHHMDMQKLGMEQQAAQQDHNRSMQSQEGQERVAALKQVDRVTGGV